MRMPVDTPDTVGHAELQLGNSVIMLSDEFPSIGALGPKSIGGSPVTMHVDVEDVHAVFDEAVRAGARALEEPTDQFYGDRSGQFEDPFGHRWNMASHVEDVPPEEMQRRMAERSNDEPGSSASADLMGRDESEFRDLTGPGTLSSRLVRRPDVTCGGAGEGDRGGEAGVAGT
jgi:PhnB protein